MAYDNTNSGAMWGNKEKQTDTQPDYKGSINIEGIEYWLAGWKRDPNGNPNAPAIKFKYTRKDEVQAQGMQQAQQTVQQAPVNAVAHHTTAQQQAEAYNNQPVPVDNLDDDIPF